METRNKMENLWSEAKSNKGVGKELHDVKFFILGNDNQCLGQIPAHKFVLSLESEVFRTMFSRKFAELSLQEDGVTRVKIRDTALEAFTVLMELIYETWETEFPGDLDLLFEVLCLADKYFLENIKKLLVSTIEWFPVGSANYVRVYRAVQVHKHIMGLETLCADLWDRCAGFRIRFRIGIRMDLH